MIDCVYQDRHDHFKKLQEACHEVAIGDDVGVAFLDYLLTCQDYWRTFEYCKDSEKADPL